MICSHKYVRIRKRWWQLNGYMSKLLLVTEPGEQFVTSHVKSRILSTHQSMAVISNVHGAESVLHIIENEHQDFPFTVPMHICQDMQKKTKKKNTIVDFARNCRS